VIERKKSLYKEGSLDRLLTKLFQPDDSITSLKLVVEYFLIKIQTPYKFFYLPKISKPNLNPKVFVLFGAVSDAMVPSR
jgi:hypothetical protein